ncbi:MAG: nuclear transport factor 2 family protein [Actinomycetota bacterium]
MTEEHPNTAKVRAGYDAFARADLEALREFLAEDIVWHFPGSSPMAGDYRGHEEVFGFFMNVFEQTGGTFTVEVRDVMANDAHGVAVVHVSGERDGKTIASNQVHVAHVSADGRVTEFWNMPEDVRALDEFWS